MDFARIEQNNASEKHSPAFTQTADKARGNGRIGDRLDRLLRAAVNQTERSKADNQEADKQIGSRPAGGGYRRIRDGKKQEKAARRAKEA